MASQDSEPRAAEPAGHALHDRRPQPRGVLPRHIQMWLMAGIALVILVIIFFTGHATPAPKAATAQRPPEPILAATDRIRAYRQQLAEEQVRQQQLQAQEAAASASAAPRAAHVEPTAATAPDALVEEQRRRNYQSLFADSVALSRRPAAQQPYGEHGTRLASTGLSVAPVSAPVAPPAAVPSSTAVPVEVPHPAQPAGEPARDEHPAPGPRLRLLEGTVIEAVLTNRLDGALAGPVNGLVTNAVYSPDRQSVLIPAGARVLGTAAPVQSWGESRLAVSFHRLVMPDGHTYTLDKFRGLDQIGETGLRDSVNRHYLQVFGASLAIGAISGLAQYNTRGGLDYSFTDAYRQAAGASLATSTARILDRYLNVLPTITIHEGYRLKVYLTNDLELPTYASAEPAIGGAR